MGLPVSESDKKSDQPKKLRLLAVATPQPKAEVRNITHVR